MVDAHCHLALYPKPEVTADESNTHVLAVSLYPSDYAQTKALAVGRPHIHPAVGMHPENVVERQSELDQLWGLLDDTRYVGEVGLDYTVPGRKLQRDVFERVLDECAGKSKVISVHARGAVGDALKIVGPNYDGVVILHWFTGDLVELQRAVDYGLYFSVNEAMTRTGKGLVNLSHMPQDRVLTETDGPYIKGLDGQPSKVGRMVRYLASMWKMDVASVQARIDRTAESMF